MSPTEAQRCFHSLRTHVLCKRYKEFIRVYARSEEGRIHYHVLVVMDRDIRTGCSFARLKRKDYRHAPVALREEWKFWTETASRYGFGRTELLPIEKNAAAIANYFKANLASRAPEDKGVRLVGYSKGTAIGNTSFCWNTDAARRWRKRLALCADILGCCDLKSMRVLLGRYWAYKYRRFIDYLTPETAADAKRILHECVKGISIARRRKRLLRELDSLQNALLPSTAEILQYFVKLAPAPLACSPPQAVLVSP